MVNRTGLRSFSKSVIGALEVLSERDGAIVFGWVAEDVHYAQLIERCSSSLGMRYASRLDQQLVGRTGVRLFSDCSGLDTYELCARNALQRVLFARRHSCNSAIILARTRIVELGAQVLAAHLRPGLFHVTLDRSEFVAELDRCAPLARRYIRNPTAWVQAATSVPPP